MFHGLSSDGSLAPKKNIFFLNKGGIPLKDDHEISMLE